MTIKEARTGAINNIFYEIIPGVGFRADYVVHTPGDYFIKIVIDDEELPLVTVPCDGMYFILIILQ